MTNWHGVRVTLGCGHMLLRDAGYGPSRIGALAACDICPTHTVYPAGHVEARVRHVVDIAGVDAPQKPDDLGPEHWY
jgi:hypothetical protein